MTDAIYSALRNYLDRLGAAEYAAFKASKASKRKGARYQPSEYQQDLVRLLGQDDEHGFKALKALQGYASALGV